MRIAAQIVSIGVLAAAFATNSALAQVGDGPSADASPQKLIVKFRDRGLQARGATALGSQASALSARAGAALAPLRTMSGGAHVFSLNERVPVADLDRIVRAVASDPTVLYVEPDIRLHHAATPNDPAYGEQWHYFEPVGGINLPNAWDVTVGKADVVVAVIDTGFRPHADLVGKLVQGFDFISNVTTANDGDGRDADASDPGDSCFGQASSWHGTHVAGTIGADTNNSVGVAGVSWGSRIQPVRVLGTCGGDLSDIADGMRWAAGLAVPGAPANATRAKVLNLSLGGMSACTQALQSAVNDIIAAGATVVVAGGNSNMDMSGFTPANCQGVIAVAATNRVGSKAGYSNFGTIATISAPGGETGGVPTNPNGVLSTLNTGLTVPDADSFAFYEGTSMATPHVAGVVALMLSVNRAYTPVQVVADLRSTARAFPVSSTCSAQLCGAGIVDASAAVRAAQRRSVIAFMPVLNLLLAD